MSIEAIVKELKEEIGRLTEAVRVLEGTKSKAGKDGTKPRRKMSAAGRRRIAAAQRARWKKIREAKK